MLDMFDPDRKKFGVWSCSIENEGGTVSLLCTPKKRPIARMVSGWARASDSKRTARTPERPDSIHAATCVDQDGNI
jgi:hypothetical protein